MSKRLTLFIEGQVEIKILEWVGINKPDKLGTRAYRAYFENAYHV
ncbi:hypothetical protein [Paenibacillus radicis (ex Xue et al. 2023)]|uniref:Uncharacterized protein n=1 Tax=Paenibacillus radicis (ex Xue et al. 2023) TaxID=2972489 RepID=A0ABT1YQ99_9BACL|nr:hypothetical protein [Paenibacillus radicis (ex Xue et al. 2023)]MCR8635358.1 hypothetical protein [Paenibacillus radicis (ex Xue et al. 2023)]